MAGNIQNIMSVNALEAAARMADIESLYRVIEQDPYVLEHIDSVPFVNTPLHVAASVDLPGHTQFATEIMILKPSFALKINPQGLTPIHLALQNRCNKMVLCLVDINKDLLRVKMRGGLTPFHLATQCGDIDLLTEFLKSCPDSIEDVTFTGETALHLAVKYNFEAFKFLIKWLKKETLILERRILNRKDEDGNTILHIAALNNNIEVIKFLKVKVAKWKMNFNAKNLMGETASNLAPCTFRYIKNDKCGNVLRDVFGSFLCLYGEIRFGGEMTEENRNAYLVVATLVATATYQAALSPPGGFRQSDVFGTNQTLTHLPSNSSITDGKSVMSNKAFTIYSTMNMLAFLASTMTITALLPKKIPWFLLFTSTSLLIVSYCFSVTIISPNHFTAMFISVTCAVLYYFFSGLMFVMMASID